MKRLGLLLLILIALAGSVSGQDCKCLKTPFKPEPPCFEICAVNLLSNLDVAELQLILELGKESAEKIVQLSQDRPVRTLAEYKALVPAEEFEKSLQRINSLTEKQLKFLNRPATYRQDLKRRDRFKDLFAVSDAEILRVRSP